MTPTFRLTRPAPSEIADFVASQRGAEFTYREVGETRRGAGPAGYVVDHNRVQLGRGAEAFQRGLDALRAWRMLTHGWSSIHPAHAPIATGTTVAVLVHHYGFWSLNACRIVYVFDDEVDGTRRRGFAYGTLPSHGAVGEERFSIEWQHEDDSVWYDMYAFSRPAHVMLRLAHPFARALQRRFARHAMRAMQCASCKCAPCSAP